MKKLFVLVLIGVAALLATVQTQAQVPTFYNNTALENPTRFAAGVTNLASPLMLDVSKQGNVSLTVKIRGTAATTNLYHFGWSDDGSTYSTNAPDIFIWSADSISTFNTTRTTNVACGGRGYLVLFQVNTTLINTNSMTYTTKISSP